MTVTVATETEIGTATATVTVNATATVIETEIAGIVTGIEEATDMEDETTTLARDTMMMTGMMTLELKEGTKRHP